MEKQKEKRRLKGWHIVKLFLAMAPKEEIEKVLERRVKREKRRIHRAFNILRECEEALAQLRM